ncbi:MAG: type II toxin-antitoxin system VapC family toxin [Candidatus Wukongarchaeota archaeon]|nr:PIN domain-containing protein [Candidatus Wukongarchaeota archaeon]
MGELSSFEEDELIFIDSNIFLHNFRSHEDFGEASTAFLELVERGEVRSAIDTAVVYEVSEIILLEKGSEILDTGDLSVIKNRLKMDEEVSKKAYEAVQVFYDYVEALHVMGIVVLPIDWGILKNVPSIGVEHNLSPRVALHARTCWKYEIRNIATSDTKFEKISWLKVWKP